MRTKLLQILAVLSLFGASCSSFAGSGPSAERGRVVFDKWCAACHGSGSGHPGTIALQAKYNGTIPAELEKRDDLNRETIHYFVRNGVSVMPFFRKTEITDADEADLAMYLTKKKPAKD